MNGSHPNKFVVSLMHVYFNYLNSMQFYACHESTKKGEIVRIMCPLHDHFLSFVDLMTTQD
jgi:hypothetical protein